MKRLVKKSSQNFIHVTNIDYLESILNNGLLPGQSSGSFYDNSLMNNSGVYVSTQEIKNERLSELNELGSVLLELSLDTNNMVPDPEYFNLTGPHALSTSDIIKIAHYVADSNLFQQNYLSKFNIEDYEDVEEFVDNEYDKIIDELYVNNFELAKLLQPGLFYELSDFVYLGNIPTSSILKIYISNENNEIKEFNPSDREEIIEFINNKL